MLPFDIKLGNMFKCFDGINSVLNKENCFASIYNANRDVETEASILRSLLNQRYRRSYMLSCKRHKEL